MTHKMTMQQVLLNPGPVRTTERVRTAAASLDICHREPEFSRLLTGVKSKLLSFAGVDDEYAAIMVSGSGTSALEAVLASSAASRKSVVVVTNGFYGDRLLEIARLYSNQVEIVRFPWGVPFQQDQIEAVVKNFPGCLVAMVHHETSTGMLNPISIVSRIASEYGCEIFVDAISSFGCESIEISELGLDWVAISSNKCIESIPGVAFVIVRTAVLSSSLSDRSYTLDLGKLYRAQDIENRPAFTPPIPALFALDVALEELVSESRLGRFFRYQRMATRMRDGLEALGMKIFVDNPNRSVSLTCFDVGEERVPQQLLGALRSDGFVAYASQGEISTTHLRVSTMGQISDNDIDRFLQSLGTAL